MALGRRMATFNRHVTNRLLGRAATRLPRFGVVLHVGRRSGRPYRTPVNVFTATGYRMALTYGSGADWVRDIVVAGGCGLVTRGTMVRLRNPRLVRAERAAGVPAPARALLRLTRVTEFLDLDLDPAPDARVAGQRAVS